MPAASELPTLLFLCTIRIKVEIYQDSKRVGRNELAKTENVCQIVAYNFQNILGKTLMLTFKILNIPNT